jgi:hypothetical protein
VLWKTCRGSDETARHRRPGGPPARDTNHPAEPASIAILRTLLPKGQRPLG